MEGASTRTPTLWLAACAACAVSCGEELIPGELTDRPIFSVQGSILGLDDSPLHITALWVDPLGQYDDWPSPPSVALDTRDTSGNFELRFFRPPPRENIRRIPSPENPDETAFAFAFAEIVAFEDRDGDGTFKVSSLASGSTILHPDLYRGTADSTDSSYVVFYLERSRISDANVVPELDTILVQPPGYYLAQIGCGSATRGKATPFPHDQRSVVLSLVPATSMFPGTRICLRAHAPLPGS
jgi:hypothetical protein